MSTVYTDLGDPIESLAVATEDAILTVVARLDILDDDSLSWLAKRCLLHAEECNRSERPESAKVFMALVRAIEEVQQDLRPSK